MNVIQFPTEQYQLLSAESLENIAHLARSSQTRNMIEVELASLKHKRHRFVLILDAPGAASPESGQTMSCLEENIRAITAILNETGQ